MKLLILSFLLSFSAFAQYRAEVKDKDGNILGGDDFPTSLEAQVWVEENYGKGALSKAASHLVEDVSIKRSEESEIEVVLGDIQKGMRAIAWFRVRNDKKALTNNQKKQLLGDVKVKDIMGALSIGNLPVAKELIEAYQPDGAIVTEQDKADFLTQL